MCRVSSVVQVLVALLGADVTCAVAAPRKIFAPTPSIGVVTTTLRATPPSFILSGRNGQKEIRYVSVEVTNIGRTEAKEIQVSLRGGSGLSFTLRGPKRLLPHARGVYVATTRMPHGVASRGQVLMTCGTCRR